MSTIRVGRYSSVEFGPLKAWRSASGDLTVTRLFRLHDQEGVPLSMSIGHCVERGMRPALADFAADAYRAGWKPDSIVRTIISALADSGISRRLAERYLEPARALFPSLPWEQAR